MARRRRGRRLPLSEINEEFENMVAEIIDTYEKELTVKLDDVMKEVAHEFKDDLYPNVPVSDGDGGKYGHLRDNLTVSNRKKKDSRVYEVHFGKKGWLSTLLEYGWRKRNSNEKVERTPFVRPVFEKNKAKYLKKIVDEANRQLGGKK